VKLSVIIACLNEEKNISTQLQALAEQEWSEPWELLVCDNGSTDNTTGVVETFRQKIPNLRIVDASQKRGQPYALNCGVAHARSDNVAFCDSDDAVGSGWVPAMGEALKEHEFVGGRFDLKRFNQHGILMSHAQEDGLNKLRYPPYLEHTGSGNMGVRKSLHQEVGGFDESMPYLFDTDFCFKVQLKGHKLHYLPAAVLHVRRPNKLSIIYKKAQNYGKYHVLLYKRYRPQGMPELTFANGVRSLVRLLIQPLTIRNKIQLASWAWSVGWRVGWFKGCLAFRVFVI